MKVNLPKMGESVFEATITKWLKKVGDKIEQDEPLVQVATDKVDTEIPSPVSGTIKEIYVKEGEVAKVGNPIVEIITSEEASGESVVAAADVEKTTSPKSYSTELIKDTIQEKIPTPSITVGIKAKPEDGSSKKFISPLVRTIAKEYSIPLSEIENIQGTGLGGRVTKRDILAYIESKKKAPIKEEIPVIEVPAPSLQKVVEVPEPAVSVPSAAPIFGEVIEMDRVRKLIADHMIKSKQTSAHTTLVVDVNVSNIVIWREKNKEKFEKEEGFKLTYLPVVIQAVIYGIRHFPLLNSSVDGTKIIIKKNINIGIAVALPNWNLIVPVIKDADKYNLRGLAREINLLATKARNNKLSPDDIKDGTFTISNFGTFNGLIGTPIINQPQVAILGVGTFQKVPGVIETPYGDVIGIVHKAFLSLTHDHRIIDGALAGAFLQKVKEFLENFDKNTVL